MPDATNHLPPGWRVVRFDQMAESITERVDKPSEAGVEYYVGLEHLDPESLKLRRWGTPDDVSATKLKFQPGDIIFGRRRAYQRKLAVAEFEGICSAHALVLRAREDTVLPGFLPFFMQSDVFFERAMAISVGSLSPTINWKALARQEFAIPPRAEQQRIAELLWAADAAVEGHLTAQEELNKSGVLLFEHYITKYERQGGGRYRHAGCQYPYPAHRRATPG
ncbi:MAG: restriction endonuclease subunit S [Chloroflexaceae bacterium]